jgi:hypothetical protein
MKIGYVYHIFPVEVPDDPTAALIAIEKKWQWKYFSWFFNLTRVIISILCDIQGIDPVFPVWVRVKKK